MDESEYLYKKEVKREDWQKYIDLYNKAKGARLTEADVTDIYETYDVYRLAEFDLKEEKDGWLYDVVNLPDDAIIERLVKENKRLKEENKKLKRKLINMKGR